MIEQFLPVTIERVEQSIRDAEASPVVGEIVQINITTALVLARSIEVIARIPEDKITHPVLRGNVRTLSEQIPSVVRIVQGLASSARPEDETISLIIPIAQGIARAARLVILLEGAIAS